MRSDFDWSSYFDQTLCAQWETVVVGDALGFILALQLKLIVHYEDWKLPEKDAKKWIHLGESIKQTHCALWDLAIWWRVFWLAASASPHPSVKLGAKVTHKDAFVASSTARRILPTPDLSHHFRIWALHLLMAVLGSNSNHTPKEILTQEKIWLGVAGLL